MLLPLAGLLLGCVVVAHLVGWLLARGLRVRPGHIHQWMPSLPDHTHAGGPPARRFERRRAAAERRLLARFAGGVEGAEAGRLAVELAEAPEVIEAALAHLREAIPCRLAVTRSGALRHAFAAEDVARLRRGRLLSGPLRAGLAGLALLANLGAAWPLLLALVIAAGTLLFMTGAEDALVTGLAGLGVLTGLYLVNLVGGVLIHLLLRPLRGGPRLGDVARAEQPGRFERDPLLRALFGDGGKASKASKARGKRVKPQTRPEKRVSSSTSGGGGGGFEWLAILDVDDVRGCLVGIVVVILIAVIAACTLALFIFARGMWRAARRIGVPDLLHGPTRWVRGTHPVDSVERFIPTNDLVLRVIRALRRVAGHTHTMDGELPGRVLQLARRRGGRVSALEIALHEALEPGEAAAVGARLAALAGGQIVVTDDGELDFAFPPGSLPAAAPAPDGDLEAEYLTFTGPGGRPRRREAQRTDRVPVNLTGLSYGHLVGTDRLVAGTLLMTLSAVAVVHADPAHTPGWVMLAVDTIMPIMALGAFALSGAARYAARVLAGHGVRRDVRRAGFVGLLAALALERSYLDLGPLADQLLDALQPAWPRLDRALVQRELDALALELELGPPEDATPADIAAGRLDVAPVRRRLDALQAAREAGTGEAMPAGVGPSAAPASDEGADDVVFEANLARDRVRVLA